jgi:hypothetical protein
MRLIIIGCEYAGKTTLMQGIKQWMIDTLGSCQSSFHDHFVLPFHEGSGPDIDKEIEVVLSMPPALLEKYSRYLIHYHLGSGFYKANDHCVVNWYYGDAVYAPIYYGFGRPGEYADRRVMARYYDAEVMDTAPDTVLLLLKASPEAIRQRMRDNPHPHSPLKEGDVEEVLGRFGEEFDHTLIRRLITLDTADSTPQQTLQEFIRQIEPHLTDRDLLRLNAHRALR